MQYTTTISSKGQITLPVKIRRSLNVDAGDRLVITKHGDKVTLVADSYEERLVALRKKTAEHLKNRSIRALKIEDLDKAIDSAWSDASVKRYEGSLK